MTARETLRAIAEADPDTPAQTLRAMAAMALDAEQSAPITTPPETWCECFRHGYDPRTTAGLPCQRRAEHARRLREVGAPRAEDLESLR